MKLAAIYFGSYKVVGRIKEVTYQLELPTCSKVHLVFLFPCSRNSWDMEWFQVPCYLKIHIPITSSNSKLSLMSMAKIELGRS
jgi:hypothetical protein